MRNMIDSNEDYLEKLIEKDIKIKDFRKLKAYQLSLDLCKECIEIANNMPSYEIFSLADQIRRSSMGVAAQIAEGNGQLYERKEVQYISIASGSLCETQCWLDLSLINKYITQEKFNELQEISESIKKLLVTYIRNYIDKNKGGK